MSEIQINVEAGPRPRSESVTSGRQSRLNQASAWVIIILLSLVPLPFGSVHGFSWGFFATFTGLLALIYALSMQRIGEQWRYPLTSLGTPAVLFGAMVVYLLIQILPIGLLTGPIEIVSSGVTVLSGNTISVAGDMTFLMLMRQLTYGLFFFLVLQVTYNDTRRRFLLDAVLVIIVAYGVLAIVSLQTGDTVLGIAKTAYSGSATGPFVNRNSFATFLGFGAIIALAQIGRRVVDQVDRHPHDGLVGGNVSTIILYGIAYALLIAVIVATQSRMGIAASVVGSLVVAVVVATRALKSRRVFLLVLGIGMLAALSGPLLFGEALFDRLFDIETSSVNRSELYGQVLQLIGMRPLTGFGGGSFELAFPLVHQEPVSTVFSWDKAHNTYLTLWSELGLLFGSLPMVMVVLVGIRLIRSLRSGQSNWMAQTIALGTLAQVGLHSLVDFSLEIQANTFMFVVLIAAGLSASRQINR
jgi:O-antigen ligase